jgi:hypothetical protein
LTLDRVPGRAQAKISQLPLRNGPEQIIDPVNHGHNVASINKGYINPNLLSFISGPLSLIFSQKYKRKNNVGYTKITIVSPKRFTVAVLCLLVFFVVMPGMAELSSDGELKNDKGVPNYYWFYRSSGHAVYFNTTNPLTITGIRIYGCKWGAENQNATVTVSIWDDHLQTLYQDQVPYAKILLNSPDANNKCSPVARWADIPLPEHTVNGNFYVTLFTDSYPVSANQHGIYIGFNTNSATRASHSAASNPNSILDAGIVPSVSNISYQLSEIDWMIRVLYTQSGNSPVTVSTTTIPSLSPASPPSVPSTSPQTPDTQLPFVTILVGVVMVLGVIGGSVYFLSAKKNRPRATPPSPLPPVQPGRSGSSHHDVFISYAHVDKPIADGACAKLESRSIRCWMAPRDVPPGMDFPAAIIQGIEGSRVMVLIFSSHSNASPHVLREITSAVNKGIIIVPFRIEDIIPSKSMEYLISVPHWLDAVTPPLEQHFDHLASTIENILSGSSSP